MFAPLVLEILESLRREIVVPPVGYGALDVRAELTLLDACVFEPTVFAWVQGRMCSLKGAGTRGSGAQAPTLVHSESLMNHAGESHSR